ncbi:oxygen-independent coproporphyrinogen III oxidase [Galbibacter orientalis DSM 19592]|uniref:Coproporphyrinogen-III oxidase n=1 Tax=Galbibacter orientalis DSM 19592 TaxID=926559 RepID=I3C5B8_9FLAO|nr:oxygen-independent coproporphyrinogen III oxidase [Galbibacter orientalis]EIJ38811.1 oxygen-independent coproporphyrinogen III oxidase [Galbibacter orientalis DSM 19592]
MSNSLIQKYNVPGPRYTSYPTVPFWDSSTFSSEKWKTSIKQSFSENNGELSLYIHLPYCESLCTFCGCHKRITKRHELESPYIKTLLEEWKLYLFLFETTPKVKEIHLGGGTPTFFSAENLKQLIDGIFKYAEKADDYEFSFEGHPNNTTKEHLQTLYNLGFRRVSYGVQDYNLEIQQAIHRIQPFENVKKATDLAREIGYTSISHDLIFGLPFQKMEHVVDTINKTLLLMPERIAFYSYAHVPWVKGNGQRGFDENDIPKGDEKRTLYETGKKLLEELGYIEIGMDHFALKRDSLTMAMNEKELHRNFMGYTTQKTNMMIGLGASSISDSWYAFAQNVKNIEEYSQLVEEGIIPVFRGHVLDKEDLIIRKHILNLMCNLQTSWESSDSIFEDLPNVVTALSEFENDGLISICRDRLIVNEKGRPFVRNICMAFDMYLKKSKPENKLFSMTV